MHLRTLTTTVALVMLPVFGCTATAPIHSWTPPRLHSTVGQTVVMASIVGERDVAERLAAAIAETRPRELSRAVVLVPQWELQRHSEIQLASAVENVPSDLALLSAARAQGLDYLLVGEILDLRGGRSPLAQRAAGAGPTAALSSLVPASGLAPGPSAAQAPPRLPAGPSYLTVSWRLMDVGEARLLGGLPVTVSTASLGKLHPDLADAPADEEQKLATAAARETWKLLVPYVRRTSVALAKPYLTPGATDVRRGNAEAAALRWAEAEAAWQRVLEQHPRNHAAMHNLAIAAAARQDFATAKQLAQSALQIHPWGGYERTVVWIESRQRELAEAFGLPKPDEGWLFAPD